MSKIDSQPRHLVVIHYHLRPGGVRRILELALPCLVSAPGSRLAAVTVAAGERDEEWAGTLRRSWSAGRLEFFCEPAFRYLSEQRSAPEAIRRRIRAALRRLMPDPREAMVWAHNLGLARNLLLADELARFSAAHGVRMISHHHDFWFENRWTRWQEMRRCGFRSLSAVARAVFAAGAAASHATINGLDDALLGRHLRGRHAWLPNLASPGVPPSRRNVAAGRKWLSARLGDDAPVWIFPTRFLRRKNLAEAVLLARWLNPRGWMITTAGVSSADEKGYAGRLRLAARQRGWRVRFSLLAEAGGTAPGIREMIAASQAIMLTSVQEGFGLPYIEAAAFGKPLIARSLPNVAPDLLRFGFEFPNLYRDVLVPPSLVDLRRERTRQRALWRSWKAALPASVRSFAGRPPLLEGEEDVPVAFSRLTLEAQLEVLAIPPEESLAACGPLNPFLKEWRLPAQSGRLKAVAWPDEADKWIGAAAYAERFYQLADRVSRRAVSPQAAIRAQRDFVAQRLGSDFLFPLLLQE